MNWPFTNYTSQLSLKPKQTRKPEIKPLPKRDLPAPKEQPKTDRIKRSNSKV